MSLPSPTKIKVEKTLPIQGSIIKILPVEVTLRKVRYYIFLKDVFLLAISAFGGPQAHLAHLFDRMVKKRRYISEEDLIELNALCQILPGPTSTQTISAIGFKVGGPKLAYLALLVWCLPAVTIMTTAAIIISHLQYKSLSLEFTKYIQPMAVGFVAYAAYKITRKVVNSKTAISLFVLSTVVSYFLKSPYMFPLLLLFGGFITAFKYKRHKKEEKNNFNIKWNNFFLWAGVFVLAAVLGAITQSLPIRLFENFYRNGSLVFGGGQVLIPLIYTEFVEFKSYLSSEEFLTGFAFVQAVPGPVFSFSAYIGALSMRDSGIWGEISGALFASAGIFLPGTFLIFFVIRFWDQFKQYRPIKASLEGINATSSGMVAAAAILLFQPLAVEGNPINFILIAATFLILFYTKIPAPFIIVAGLIAGFII
jgi:chromate transporter